MARETLLLLPGMMCDERLFAPQVAAFSGSHAVLVPVLDKPSIVRMAENVLSGAPEGPLNIAGLSMGGIVAMMVAALAPERVARLALLDTNHRADAPERYEVRNRQIGDVKAGNLRAVIIEEMKPVYLAAENRSDQALLDLLVQMAMDVGEDAFVAQSIALRDRPDQSGVLRRFEGPALVLCGAEDRLCPPERHREIAGLLKRPDLVEVQGAGHISTLENPAAVNAAMARWLATPL